MLVKVIFQADPKQHVSGFLQVLGTITLHQAS